MTFLKYVINMYMLIFYIISKSMYTYNIDLQFLVLDTAIYCINVFRIRESVHVHMQYKIACFRAI